MKLLMINGKSLDTFHSYWLSTKWGQTSVETVEDWMNDKQRVYKQTTKETECAVVVIVESNDVEKSISKMTKQFLNPTLSFSNDVSFEGVFDSVEVERINANTSCVTYNLHGSFFGESINEVLSSSNCYKANSLSALLDEKNSSYPVFVVDSTDMPLPDGGDSDSTWASCYYPADDGTIKVGYIKKSSVTSSSIRKPIPVSLNNDTNFRIEYSNNTSNTDTFKIVVSYTPAIIDRPLTGTADFTLLTVECTKSTSVPTNFVFDGSIGLCTLNNKNVIDCATDYAGAEVTSIPKLPSGALIVRVSVYFNNTLSSAGTARLIIKPRWL